MGSIGKLYYNVYNYSEVLYSGVQICEGTNCVRAEHQSLAKKRSAAALRRAELEAEAEVVRVGEDAQSWGQRRLAESSEVSRPLKFRRDS